jgi:hypothetical protein
MASGHVNRTKRPNTWLHRPACGSEESPCQLGAVHTWHETAVLCVPTNVCSWWESGHAADITTKTDFDPSLPFDDQSCCGAQQRSPATVVMCHPHTLGSGCMKRRDFNALLGGTTAA